MAGQDPRAPVAADPHQSFSSNQAPAILARAPLGQHEVEFSGVEDLKKPPLSPTVNSRSTAR